MHLRLSHLLLKLEKSELHSSRTTTTNQVMESQHQQGMDTDKHLSYMTPAVLYTETGIKKKKTYMLGLDKKKTFTHYYQG